MIYTGPTAESFNPARGRGQYSGREAQPGRGYLSILYHVMQATYLLDVNKVYIITTPGPTIGNLSILYALLSLCSEFPGVSPLVKW